MKEVERTTSTPSSKLIIRVRNIEKAQWYWHANAVMDDYLPLIGMTAYTVYSTYCRRAINQTQSTKLPQDVIAKHLGVRKSTVSECVKVLEWCGLIRVVRNHRLTSQIFLPPVSALTPEGLKDIEQRVLADMGDDVSPKYAKLGQALLGKLAEWRNLPNLIKNYAAKGQNQEIEVVIDGEDVEAPQKSGAECSKSVATATATTASPNSHQRRKDRVEQAEPSLMSVAMTHPPAAVTAEADPPPPPEQPQQPPQDEEPVFRNAREYLNYKFGENGPSRPALVIPQEEDDDEETAPLQEPPQAAPSPETPPASSDPTPQPEKPQREKIYKPDKYNAVWQVVDRGLREIWPKGTCVSILQGMRLLAVKGKVWTIGIEENQFIFLSPGHRRDIGRIIRQEMRLDEVEVQFIDLEKVKVHC